ncbi:MAG: hypothetical protein COA49_00855 [Bacteroidetes bacterium]|nr:MAG: hypothetical protein COA49_00855 [Bacteroidota bacterium]
MSSLLSYAHSQSPLSSVGNHLLNFSESSNAIGVTDLPVAIQAGGYPSEFYYNGSIPQKHQAVQFDNEGNLLFFVVDGKVYDGNGRLIVANSTISISMGLAGDWPNMDKSFDIAIAALPGSCTKFIFIYRYQAIPYSFNIHDEFFILDMSKKNRFWDANSGVYGNILIPSQPEFDGDEALLYDQNGLSGYNSDNWGDFTSDWPMPDSLIIDFPFQGNSSSLFNELIFLPSTVKQGSVHYEFIHDELNNSLRLFMISDAILRLITFSPEGITDYQSFYNLNDITFSRYQEGEIEAIYLPLTNEYLIAFNRTHEISLSGSDDIIFYKFNENFELIQSQGVQLPFSNDFTNVKSICGLEFTQGGEYLYFVMDDPSTIRYVNLSDMSVNLLDYPNVDESNYSFSKLEKNVFSDGISNAIYLGSENNLAAIVNPSDPASSYFVENILYTSPLTNFSIILNEGVGPSYFYLPSQNLHVENVVTQLSSGSCCSSFHQIQGVQSSTINSLLDGDWTYSNNPFSNSTGPIEVAETLVFQSGTVTNIEDMVFHFGSEAKVVIEAGARVNLINSTWTSSTCDSIMWPGVELLGTTNNLNSIDQAPTTGGDQGQLFMQYSKIENSHKGVLVGTLDTNAGGILRAYHSIFENNVIDVEFSPFHVALNDTSYVSNLSIFYKCDFITSSALKIDGLYPISHVILREVDWIRFKNCSFRNLNNFEYKTYIGTGIESIMASFMVDGDNQQFSGNIEDINHTTFYNLKYGIYSLGGGLPYSFYSCTDMEFQDCLYGIVNNETDNVVIVFNNFEMPDVEYYNGTETTERGIYLGGSTGYDIQHNTFKQTDDPVIPGVFPSAVGIWVDNSGGAPNEIRNDYFEDLKVGVIISGINAAACDSCIYDIGLQVLCNNFSNNETDIYRASHSTMRMHQGGQVPTIINGEVDAYSIHPAWNIFSDAFPNCIDRHDFVVSPLNSSYTEYWSDELLPYTYVDCISQSTLEDTPGFMLIYNIPDTDTIGEKEVFCASGYDEATGHRIPVDINLITSKNISIKSNLELATQTYNEVVDGNNTVNTISTLASVFPEESSYVRDLLMQRYPLSKTVLLSVVENGINLNPWHLTQVFLANSPLDKDVSSLLSTSGILSEFYLSFLDNYQSGIGLRQLMESEITSLKTELVRNVVLYGHQFLHGDMISDFDSSEVHIVELIQYLDVINTELGTSYIEELYAFYIQTDDLQSAQSLLFSYPVLIDYALCIDILNIINDPDSTVSQNQITDLWAIQNNESSFYRSFAYSLLQYLIEIDAEPEPEFPWGVKRIKTESGDSDKDVLLSCYPNPSSGVTWITYPRELDGVGLMRLIDSSGRSIAKIELKNNGLLELDLSKYSPGLYLVALEFNNSTFSTTPLTILH